MKIWEAGREPEFLLSGLRFELHMVFLVALLSRLPWVDRVPRV